MKKIMQLLFVISILFISSFSIFAQAIPEDSLYLGQTPPGNTPKIFNLPVTSGHRACERIAITSDGKEIYYGELNTYPPSSYRVRCIKYQDNKWQGPFNVFEGYTAPKLSVNDSIIYMQNNVFYTYFSIRTDSGWSVPVRLLSKNLRTHYFQRTNLNNSYASSYYEGSPTDGNLSKLITVNQDTILQNLGIPLNSSMQENDFFMAADESYIFFSKNVTGGAGDIYLSFKKDNGRWTNPKNLGAPINKPGYEWEYGQFVTQDGKYLFFTSGGQNMPSYYTYWVKIDNIIDCLRATNFVPYLNYQIPDQSFPAGKLCSYTLPDSTFFDDDGNNTLTLSAKLSNGNPLPDWLSFNSTTRTFSGIPTIVGGFPKRVTVTAKDTANASAYATFSITVVADPVGVEEDREQLPESMNLYQNYPNPFNPTTNIEFAISKSEFVSLKIYDTLGREVKDVFNGNLNAGNHSFEFDANNFSCGIYFYVLKTNTFCVQKKMVVLK
ncbi:MAG: putative Ig domain-containing protein [Ignavibacteriales bacterium]|nr:putative Ig domain-containing protein [Ignavibacteriales bacterium]